MILAGDIGGTHSRLSLYRLEGARLVRAWNAVYRSREHRALVEILQIARTQWPAPPRAAALGIAGPVRAGVVRATNLPWQVESAQLAQTLGLERVHLLNDLEAAAWGLLVLPADGFVTLQQGSAEHGGNMGLLAPGTGLGQAGLCFDGELHHPFASEGGHASFAPTDEAQVELWHDLRRQFGVVSWERVLSGPGIVSIYAHLLARGRHGPQPAWLAQRMQTGDAAAEISRAASQERDPVAVAAMETFVGLLGAAAGNLALQLYALGGVYLGGGIAPRILPWLRHPALLASFLDKGRMRPLLETIPLHVLVDSEAAERGAALHAALREGLLQDAPRMGIASPPER